MKIWQLCYDYLSSLFTYSVDVRGFLWTFLFEIQTEIKTFYNCKLKVDILEWFISILNGCNVNVKTQFAILFFLCYDCLAVTICISLIHCFSI